MKIFHTLLSCIVMVLWTSQDASSQFRAEDLPYCPDVLTMQNGQKILSARSWEEKRRPEILELFRENVYGNLQLDFDSLSTQLVSMEETDPDMKTIFKHIIIQVYRNSNRISFNVLMYLPADMEKPCPAFLLINHRTLSDFNAENAMIGDYWPADKLVRNGFAAILINSNDVAADNNEHFSESLLQKLYPEELAKVDGMRTISAWAWGASRVMDYLETDPAIDHSRVALVGHSRSGKTALWCGANDQRFRLIISNNSGNSGAALSRRSVGESVQQINQNFPYWFCDNYKKYNNTVDDLPVDQHMLLSLIAPRALYVASASEDEWADPLGEFLSLNMAVPVYKLYFPLMETLDYPADYETHSSGQIAYHMRKGKHALTEYDWDRYIRFFKSLENQ